MTKRVQPDHQTQAMLALIRGTSPHVVAHTLGIPLGQVQEWQADAADLRLRYRRTLGINTRAVERHLKRG